jgi:hypothetical protein
LALFSFANFRVLFGLQFPLPQPRTVTVTYRKSGAAGSARSSKKHARQPLLVISLWGFPELDWD